jgi:superfamily II DNA/RNA helicase
VPFSPARPRTTHSRNAGSSATPQKRSKSRNTGSSRPPRQRTDDALERALAEAAALPEPQARTFDQFGLPQALVTALARQGLNEPFAIQTRVLPDALAGRDILARATTGSGKTLAFSIPLLTRLAEGGPRPLPGRPRAVVVVPTRELARQVADVLGPLAQALGRRVTTVVGGLPINKQIDQVRRGVDVVVATPGRLLDIMERGACSLDAVEVTVLDEADHLADLGFLPDVRRILDATPGSGDASGRPVQRMLLSATLDRGIDKLVRDYLRDPAVHAVTPPPDLPDVMDHRVFTVRPDEKTAVAAEIAARPGRTLFFVRTRHGADRLAKHLERAGVAAAAIHGDRSQNQRQRALDAFAAGHPRVLVATDVAARGIHVDDVDLVVHYDLPADHKDYLHRSGRTARAGASGTVLALAEPWQRRDLTRLHRDAQVTPTTSEAVGAGHPAVREVAESGEPVVVTTPPRRDSGPDNRPDRPKRRPRGAAPQGARPRRHGSGNARPARAPR